ncbi:MAG: hypothetical protein WBE98_08225, partial [Gammaproteobacteria bacterium]
RPDSPTIGNGWTEKFPDAFSIVNNEVVHINTVPFGVDYHDAIVYRPIEEDRRDVEVGIEFRPLPGQNFPQVHARIQRDTIEQPNTLNDYLFFVDGFEPSPGRAIIARQQPVPGQYECYMLGIPFPTPLEVGARYRLRFRVTGTLPVVLQGIVERATPEGWETFASGTVAHYPDGQVPARDPDLYCDPGFMPGPLTEPGAVGFAKWQTANEVLDNFFWTDLGDGSNPVALLTEVEPTLATAGSADLALTVRGAGFVPGSVIRWNGQDRPTTYVSSVELVALIPASDLANPTAASIQVFNPLPGGGVSNSLPFMVTDPNASVVDFDDPSPPGTPGSLLNGIFEGIDFGIGQWAWSGPNGPNPTNHIYFATSNGTSRAVQFVGGPRLLQSITVYTQRTGVLTLSDELGQTVTRTIQPGSLELVATGWTSPSNIVTIQFSEGWELGVDRFVLGASSGEPQPSNPLPQATELSPGSVFAGSGAFTLTVRGLGFVPESQVRWNGSARPTTYVSPTELRAVIGASDVAAPGTASVTVASPAPGGGISNALPFEVTDANVTVVDFDNPSPPGTPGGLLNGIFQGIDFGIGQWAWDGPNGPNPTNHIYFATSAGTSRTIQFAGGPRLLESITAFTLQAGVLTLSDDQGQTVTRTIQPGSLELVPTGWTVPSSVVTIEFSEGWELGVDRFAYR